MHRTELIPVLERMCELAAAAEEGDVRIVLNALLIALREGSEKGLAEACVQFAAERQAGLS